MNSSVGDAAAAEAAVLRRPPHVPRRTAGAAGGGCGTTRDGCLAAGRIDAAAPLPTPACPTGRRSHLDNEPASSARASAKLPDTSVLMRHFKQHVRTAEAHIDPIWCHKTVLVLVDVARHDFFSSNACQLALEITRLNCVSHAQTEMCVRVWTLQQILRERRGGLGV